MLRITFIALILSLFSPGQLRSQGAEVMGAGGLGFSGGSGQPTHFSTGGGLSLGWLSVGRSGLKLDYFFENTRAADFKRHFVTGSYVVRQRSGRTRPFFQIGAGIVHETRKDNLNAPSGGKTGIAATAGAGVTIDLSRSFFISPQLCTYWYAGPTASVLPGLSVGWRF